ncbi:BURP domain-containing protein 3-like [Amborella trichopoda]|uniref:BURP domain-containing protein 3-like n=1 Tax=Amborella trichopoda TaxID=13333 RepID=UPI0009C087A3|nr:BURP domain-containing protein 3-like [Amborella trichopoda]|eukprot:XP_020520794.1 BURP domain-containing protein 3-like [Amborella trichopoda]
MVDKTLAATSPLAHQEVDSIPFASVSLVDMLHRFSIPLDSPLAKKVARSLHMCVSPPQRSEHKFCATSLVPMHDFVSSILGPKAKPQVLAATLYIGENRPPLACHLDTSNRDPNNVSFKVLAITPGSEPVCHFFLESHLGFHFHFSRSGHVIMILTMLDNLNAIVVTCNCVSVFVTKAFRMSK